MPRALSNILLGMYVVASVVFDKKTDGCFADGFLVGGLCSSIMRSVSLIGGHLII